MGENLDEPFFVFLFYLLPNPQGQTGASPPPTATGDGVAP